MNLKKIRQLRGYSQSQLAEKSGVNVRIIQHYEQGSKNINHAKLETLLKLAIALDCQLLEILDDPKLRTLLNLLNESR